MALKAFHCQECLSEFSMPVDQDETGEGLNCPGCEELSVAEGPVPVDNEEELAPPRRANPRRRNPPRYR